MTLTGNFWLLFLAFWPMFGALFSYLIGRKSKRARDYFANFVTIVEFGVMVLVAIFYASNEHPPTFEWTGFMGFRIYLMLDGFRAIYGIITALMWMMTTLLSREYFSHYRNRNRYYFFMLFTMTGTIGVFLSADLITTFMFFEMMSFTSYVMVIHDESKPAAKAADTYMAVAVIGGLAMLMGIFLVKHTLGTTEIGALYDTMHNFTGDKTPLYVGGCFMLIGFGGKAGVYPLHIWLPNAHPVAPAPASALLSGVLTKTGIFGIIVMAALIFNSDYNWGLFMLILGVLGMFTGALLALFSINLKRTLACSSVSQIGFIMVGVGMQGILGAHNALAVRGTLMHMVNHSLIKLVLFMMAGVVYMNLHKLDLNEVRGFGRKKPLLIFAFAMGVLTIIGMPFWSGYVSKTMLHESIVEQIWLYPDYVPAARFFQVVESIFTLTGGLTTAYMIKIFTCVCIEKNQFNQDKMTSLNGRYMNKTSAFALVSSACLLPILGVNPDALMIPISKFGQEFMHGHDPAHAVEFFAWINLKGAVASLAIGAIIYVFIVRGCLMAKDAEGRSIYINRWPKYVDLEEYVYRPVLLRFLPFVGALAARIIGSIPGWIASLGYKVFMAFRQFWIDNTGKGLVAETLGDARGFMEARTEHPMINTEKMRESYASVATRVAGTSEVIWEGEGDLGTDLGLLREGVMTELLAEADEAKANLPPDDHGHGGHDDHGDHAHGGQVDDHEDEHAHGAAEKPIAEHLKDVYESSKERFANRGDEEKKERVVATEDEHGDEVEMKPAGLYDWVVFYATKIYRKLRKVFRIRDERYGEPDKEPARASFLKNDLMRTIFNSLAYSLLLFLIGFVVVLLFILNRG